MQFTVHHTCSKKGGSQAVLKNFPFLSTYDPKKGKTPFLGEGYYFWDFNFEYAKQWGKTHYYNSYFVCESTINVNTDDDTYFLDLVGNRKQLVGFVDLLREFNLIHKEGTKGIDLCFIINYLREECPEEAFPFEVIRAVDCKNNELKGVKIVFNENMDSYTILNPRIIIAYRNKEKIVHLTEPLIKFAS